MAQKTINEQIAIIDKKIEEMEQKKADLIKKIADLKAKRKELERKENKEFMKDLESEILKLGLTSDIDKAQIKSMLQQLGNK